VKRWLNWYVVVTKDEADGKFETNYDWTIVLGGTKYVSFLASNPSHIY
jgi:hypothetical protein